MNKSMFPSIKDIPSFNKIERAYLRELLSMRLLELSRSISDAVRSEEAAIQVILDKLEEQD